jgi:tRNA splicing ligase
MIVGKANGVQQLHATASTVLSFGGRYERRKLDSRNTSNFDLIIEFKISTLIISIINSYVQILGYLHKLQNALAS